MLNSKHFCHPSHTTCSKWWLTRLRKTACEPSHCSHSLGGFVTCCPNYNEKLYHWVTTPHSCSYTKRRPVECHLQRLFNQCSRFILIVESDDKKLISLLWNYIHWTNFLLCCILFKGDVYIILRYVIVDLSLTLIPHCAVLKLSYNIAYIFFCSPVRNENGRWTVISAWLVFIFRKSSYDWFLEQYSVNNSLAIMAWIAEIDEFLNLQGSC